MSTFVAKLLTAVYRRLRSKPLYLWCKEVLMTLSEKLYNLRRKKGLSQEALSGFAPIARSHLSMIETGSKQANFETIWRLAEALDMKPSELVAEIEEEIAK